MLGYEMRVLFYVFGLVIGFCCDGICQDSDAGKVAACLVRVGGISGSGSGFVVNSSRGIAEIWTSGHIFRSKRDRPTVRFKTDVDGEVAVAGRIAAWSNKGHFDVCKIVCTDPRKNREFLLVDVSDGAFWGGDAYGFSGGHRLFHTQVEPGGFNYGLVVGYVPPPVSGESGGPILGRSGAVIGVQMLRIGSDGEAFGGFLPIRYWLDFEKWNRELDGGGHASILRPRKLGTVRTIK